MSNVRVASISDAQNANTEKLTASSTELNVVTSVMVDTSTAQHGIVFNFRTAKGGAVGADNHQLGLSLADALQSGLVAQAVLAALHNESKARVYGFNVLLLLKLKIGLIDH